MFESILQILRYEPWQALFELAVIGLCVWLVFSFLRGTRGANVIRGFALLLVVTTVVIRGVGQGSDSLARLSFIYERLIGLLALILIVVFQPELRAALIRIGQGFDWRGRRTLARRVVAPVAEAAAWLSKSRFGALIAIERRTKVGELTERGEELDARLSARLLQSIFFPNSPLHDLGVVVRDDRIVAAGVQFPLAEQGALDPSFGSRHRAGVGLSAESDCLVVIVSEEQGTISIAEGGRLEYDIPRDRLAEVLARRLGVEEAPAGAPDPAASSEDLAA